MSLGRNEMSMWIPEMDVYYHGADFNPSTAPRSEEEIQTRLNEFKKKQLEQLLLNSSDPAIVESRKELLALVKLTLADELAKECEQEEERLTVSYRQLLAFKQERQEITKHRLQAQAERGRKILEEKKRKKNLKKEIGGIYLEESNGLAV